MAVFFQKLVKIYPVSIPMKLFLIIHFLQDNAFFSKGMFFMKLLLNIITI